MSEIRIVVLGDTQIGKTTLINRIVNGVFTEGIQPTIGPGTSRKKVTWEDRTITLNFWDTAGQERYQSMSRQFYRDSQIACICYACNNPETFSSLQTWKSAIREEEPNCQLILVGLKLDLVGPHDGDPVKQCQELADKYRIEHYTVTSAKTGENMDCLETTLAQIAVDRLTHNSGAVAQGTISIIDGDGDHHNHKKKCC